MSATPLSPAQREAAIVERYAIIPDPQERLSAIIARKSPLPGIPPEERQPEYLVPGCQSRVWIIPTMVDGRCHLQVEAESAMVRGLVNTLCELYHQATPAEIVEHEPTLFEALGIARNLTPTRLNGLAAVTAYVQNFARKQL